MTQRYIKTKTGLKAIHNETPYCWCKQCIKMKQQQTKERIGREIEEMNKMHARITDAGVTCFLCKEHLSIDKFNRPFEQNCHCKECGLKTFSDCCNCGKVMPINRFKTRIDGRPYLVCCNCDQYKRR